ncbi:predicted protein [Fibroporia radiculosa]|uniref:Uncharacterized protein n=1 Tax=Fibroporia radiculosa TaxID=599839 RepID=J7RWC4_9APHY|nr:predicted protein [Fibroporia radiculosa]
MLDEVLLDVSYEIHKPVSEPF